MCKITFRVPRPAAQEARAASVVGDFNGWRADATPMKRLRDGSFSVAMELPRGKEYRFRYLLDGGRWENDWCADRYEPSPYGGENSVVVC
ncbi:MAG: isoamylase early set domain-containing protein [Nitrospirota bacterium]